ncbi:DUF3768 domain-containing protein [Sulfitobacter sp. CW3]|uniref:DUF3768 domain-containing protein n=1 Tax=Sulfitobacter sp. CW3 TaxID=2861965 RepID=UPI001C5F56D1|nr:DUF3768 domain-containing protein [Sulfitobacter sp. CW3]MBW4961559.1 DUF3768 domain-containing protein [Sulfitobacter sp. CW3]
MTDHTNENPVPNAQTSAGIIRDLNDRFRKLQTGGTLVATPSIMDAGPRAVHAIMDDIAAFNDFTPDNDPYGEHDFGVVTYDEHRISWKIDYYNDDLSAGSSNPADPDVTTRVLTVFLASEY